MKIPYYEFKRHITFKGKQELKTSHLTPET